MTTDSEEQEDELLALQSIFDADEFVRDESESAGEIRVSVELPADFSVVLREGESLRQYDISFLPPLLLTFELPEDYPSSSPPSFTLTCSWLTHTQLAALGAHLTDLYEATGGAVVLFSWVQFLREDALNFLNIHSKLELPPDERSTLHYNQDKQDAKPSEPKNDQLTPNSEADLSVPSLEVQENPSDGSSTDSQGALALDSDTEDQNNLNCQQNQSDLTSDYQKPPSPEATLPDQTAHTPDVTALQTSEFKADSQDDLSSATEKSEPLPFSQLDQSGQEDALNEGDVSFSLLLPSTSSGLQDPSEQGAASLPVHPRDSPQNEEQTLSGLFLTPSQTLLSQILIYDAGQKKKVFAATVFDCGVCFVGWLGSECVQLSGCGHIFCRACLSEFCKVQITEGNVRGVTCPQADCTGAPTPAQVQSLVGEELFSRYDRLLLQAALDRMSDVVYCPRSSCGSAVILEKSSKAAFCSVCSFAFCVTCRKTYHGINECESKKIQAKLKVFLKTGILPQTEEGVKALMEDYISGSKGRKRLLESRYGNIMTTLESSLSENWIVDNSKCCPHCFSRIEKNGGCNNMICTQCGRWFYWLDAVSLTTENVKTRFQEKPSARRRI
ncbi:E3 ubiquitin-protein ligase RNF14-like [Archocentrus centrarchus]|uniref:E3 ubiquitin-protein ligase RNF14-like n=1 Tax=Archocentrus centrarchus TaxID=63155 RepID=UPI0011EA27CD|nr:E3 ubiquitin-protein ligase RNF14-like [Archocentrus centrarchus]XP_030583221.1 E3 ubiquitin-protein ligase RNF14-like [Archocentrus centrarchus]XP_030583222.1 E3 ubiquitin-protein ligase RNF14-like [Archocentrus centrarchus]